MPFVKLDCGMLDSTLWLDRAARDIFITALMMARPKDFVEPQPQICVQSLEPTGWQIPAGEYGFVAAAGPGIVARAGLGGEEGMSALERLTSPEAESRSQEFDGRRLARINGGYVVLNYMRYRDHDYTAADRKRKERDKKRKAMSRRDSSDSHGGHGVTTVTVTQADADSRRTTSAEYETSSDQPRDYGSTRSQNGLKAPSRKDARIEVWKKIGRQFGGKKCSQQNSPPTSTPNENSSEP